MYGLYCSVQFVLQRTVTQKNIVDYTYSVGRGYSVKLDCDIKKQADGTIGTQSMGYSDIFLENPMMAKFQYEFFLFTDFVVI